MNKILFHIVMVFIIHTIIFSCMALYGSIFYNLNFPDLFVKSLIFVFKPLYYGFFTSTKFLMYFLATFVLLMNICFFIKQNKFTITCFYFCNNIIIGIPIAILVYIFNFRPPGDGSGTY